MNLIDSHCLAAATPSTAKNDAFAPALPRPFKAITAASLVAILMGCGTVQPSLPTVDDTQRRPVNSAAALELLACRAEAQALRLNLFDPAQAVTRGVQACNAAATPAPSPKPSSGSKLSSHSSRAVFEFEAGKTELVLEGSTAQVLRRAAQNADLVLVHAAGLSESSAGDPEAKLQALATARALVKVGVEPQKLRVGWGQADHGHMQSTHARKDVGTVEVEFVERATRLVLSKTADADTPATPARPAPKPTAMPTPLPTPTPTPNPTQPSTSPDESIKPAVAALDRTGKQN